MRLNDWPERLAEYVESRRAAPFEYGSHDCCQFAAGAVEAMTGDNPAALYPYRNELGAKRIIVEHGGLDALLTGVLGEPCHPAMAGRGDIVLAELELGPTAGVCLGRNCVFPADVGVTFRPRSVIASAWKVP